MDPKPITLYEWIVERFTAAGRAEFVEQLAPTFEQLVEPQARVLDLCCGAGPFSFLFEQLGAEVTGLDNAPFMIDLARQEAGRRGSSVEFVLADVLERAKSTDADAIVDAIKKTNFTDPIMISAGPVKFNDVGDNIGASCAMIQILKGKAAVVHPKEVAEDKVVFPAPKYWERG